MPLHAEGLASHFGNGKDTGTYQTHGGKEESGHQGRPENGLGQDALGLLHIAGVLQQSKAAADGEHHHGYGADQAVHSLGEHDLRAGNGGEIHLGQAQHHKGGQGDQQNNGHNALHLSGILDAEEIHNKDYGDNGNTHHRGIDVHQGAEIGGKGKTEKGHGHTGDGGHTGIEPAKLG